MIYMNAILLYKKDSERMSELPGKIDQTEEGGLEELGHDQRALDPNQWHPAMSIYVLRT